MVSIIYVISFLSLVKDEVVDTSSSGPNLTEFLIAFSILMLMLSFVSERLSNFFKLYFQDKTIWIFFPHKLPKNKTESTLNEVRPNSSTYKIRNWSLGFVGKIRLLANKQPTQVAEKEREYRVMTINIIVGILIAVVSNANFFEISGAISEIGQEGNNNLSILTGWRIQDIENNLLAFLFGGLYILALMWSVSLMLFNRLFEVETKIPQQIIRIPFFVLLVLTIIILLCSLVITKKFFFLMQPIFLQIEELLPEIGKEDFLKELFEASNSSSATFLRIIGHTIGFVVTGLFLSLGSKFWHDLLDVLFKLKNVRQRANERITYTDHDSPEKIMALVNTSHYHVAEELFKEYEDEIWKIEGVVSVGLKSRLDKIDGFFKKKIEVEYTSSEAQEKLSKLMEKGSVSIEMNTFYLRDYLTLIYTDVLEAAFPINRNVTATNIAKIIKADEPICYAYNMKSPNSVGSFGVYIEGGKYYAHSNLHVFASPADLKRFSWQKVKNLNDEFAGLVIGKKKHENRKIVNFQFGNQGIYGKDYCTCEITQQIYEEYVNLIKEKELLSKVDPDTMKMFGAVSKELSFKKYRETTRCRVNYGSFVEELNLIKVESKDLNIRKGDSGSIVNYKVYGINGKLISKQGIIVAKSSKYAYMSKL